MNEINCTFTFTIFVVEKNWDENMVGPVAASQFGWFVWPAPSRRFRASPPPARHRHPRGGTTLIDYNKIICVKAQTSSPLCSTSFFLHISITVFTAQKIFQFSLLTYRSFKSDTRMEITLRPVSLCCRFYRLII